MNPTRFSRVFLLVGAMFATGVAGFMLIERLPVDRAIYLVIATMTTVGYGDIVPLTQAGRWFSLFVMVGGVGVGFYSLSLMAVTLVEGRLERVLGERRMRRAIRELEGHFVICGYGRVARALALELSRMGADFVVVEKNPERAKLAGEEGWLVVEGEATEESVLLRARIDKARGLATLISDDAENLYITVTTRALHPELPIIARSLLRPDVVMFLEEMIGHEREDTQLDSLRLPSGTSLHGRALSDLDLRGKYSLQVLAIKRKGRYLANPGAAEVLAVGDILVMVGPPQGIADLADLLEEEARSA